MVETLALAQLLGIYLILGSTLEVGVAEQVPQAGLVDHQMEGP
jgi:hypothetical protein